MREEIKELMVFILQRQNAATSCLKHPKGCRQEDALALYNSRKQQQDHWAQIIGGHFFLNGLPSQL